MPNKDDDHRHHDETICRCVVCCKIELKCRMAETEMQKALWDLRKEAHLQPEPVEDKKEGK